MKSTLLLSPRHFPFPSPSARPRYGVRYVSTSPISDLSVVSIARLRISSLDPSFPGEARIALSRSESAPIGSLRFVDLLRLLLGREFSRLDSARRFRFQADEFLWDFINFSVSDFLTLLIFFDRFDSSGRNCPLRWCDLHKVSIFGVFLSLGGLRDWFGVAMVDCRGLIEFCRAFEQHQNMANSQASSAQRNGNSRRKSKSLNPLSHPFCEHSEFAAIDFVLLVLVLIALVVLAVPYFKFIFRESYELLPVAIEVISEVMYQASIAYAVGLIFIFATAVVAWELLSYQARKCGNPYCKGLRKAVEFDIQLESEECVKYLPRFPKDAFGTRSVDLGQDHKELEAELKKMAPLNGRTVLTFRSPCGCPLGRMEVWGAKRARRIKK
ncbi:hypothetical protein ZIOFF_023887 [Zingiber officinale]|uniref:Ribosomal protein L34e superfamily protein n=2 Tax=Zingiber officinale TaxID=94328 RepID=A0A8J5L5W1_ZINOF|nr:hypothetical protein ZIOFF_023887 [Zingiber officinale]